MVKTRWNSVTGKTVPSHLPKLQLPWLTFYLLLALLFNIGLIEPDIYF